MLEYRVIGWWYWLAMVGLLAAGVSGWALGFTLAILLGIVQVLHFAWREQSPSAFPVQVRVAYLGLLVLGQWEPLHWIYWIPLIGTSVRVLVGYCLLARTVSLMPWNRSQPLSSHLLWRTFFTWGPQTPSCGGSPQHYWSAG